MAAGFVRSQPSRRMWIIQLLSSWYGLFNRKSYPQQPVQTCGRDVASA